MTARRCAGLMLSFAVGACAPGAMSFDTHRTPDGSASRAWDIRMALASGDLTRAQRRVEGKDAGAGDALLRELERGIVALHADDPASAAAAFDRAYWLNDARETRSLSNGVAAIMTSDVALPYRASATERAMIHYYGALAWLARGRADEAVVEARRLSALLEDLADREQPLADDLTSALREFAAGIYETAGEWADADVETRLMEGTQGKGQWAKGKGDSVCVACGELVLAVERGFVTHRVARSLGVAISDRDFAAVSLAHDDATGLVAATTALDRATAPRYCAWGRRAICGYDRREISGDFTVINVAWPELRPPQRVNSDWRLEIGDWSVEIGAQGADVSESVADDFGRDAPARVARAVARVVARQALMKAGEKAIEKSDDSKKHKTAWRVAGVLAFVGAGASMVSERADTRSWALLPDQLTVLRLRLPAGTYSVRRGGPDSTSMKSVTVSEGRTTVAALRMWGSDYGTVIASR